MAKPDLNELKRRAKESLREQGISASDWALAHGFNVSTVYNVLNNPDVKAHRGESHRIAVALGIKPAPRQTHRAAA